MAEPELNNSMPTSLVLARLGEFFGHRTPWDRGLLNVGPNLTLHEVIEDADPTINPFHRCLDRTHDTEPDQQ